MYDFFAIENNGNYVSIIDAEQEVAAIDFEILPDLIRQLTDLMVNHYKTDRHLN